MKTATYEFMGALILTPLITMKGWSSTWHGLCIVARTALKNATVSGPCHARYCNANPDKETIAKKRKRKNDKGAYCEECDRHFDKKNTYVAHTCRGGDDSEEEKDEDKSHQFGEADNRVVAMDDKRDDAAALVLLVVIGAAAIAASTARL
ncbi:hypothetical protein ON010_g10652 [Phytophthora cinnamomi]|nr:hypothetical protein ON010_g10652 [Phytophthora cinnamomi]